MADAFYGIYQERVSIPVENTWVELVVPVAARNALIGIESPTATFRVSYVNTINPETEGTIIFSGGYYYMEGVNSIELKIYISASEPTNIIMQYTKE
jgi:hypothetical protein